MRRVKLTLAYDGTEYNGWQVQPGLPTIQGALEAAFLDIEKKHVHVAGSGRTDAGVHALAQIAAVSIDNPIPPPNLKKALNRLLASRHSCHVCRRSSRATFIRASTPFPKRTSTGFIAARFALRLNGGMCTIILIRWTSSDFWRPRPLLEGEFDFSCFAASDDRDSEGRSKVRAGSSNRKPSKSETG